MEKKQGSGGISQLDGREIRKITNCNNLSKECSELASLLSKVANSFAAKRQNDESTEPFRAVRMIALEKKDGVVRPIGIEDAVKRVVTKAISRQIKR